MSDYWSVPLILMNKERHVAAFIAPLSYSFFEAKATTTKPLRTYGTDHYWSVKIKIMDTYL